MKGAEPAFARPAGTLSGEDYSDEQKGMSLREYFAIRIYTAALGGLYAAKESLNGGEVEAMLVQVSVIRADLLLTELNKSK